MNVNEALLQEIRHFLVPLWREWGRSRQPRFSVTIKGEGMCRFTSVFLADMLGPEWRLTCGTPIYSEETGELLEPGGFWDGQQWHEHCWVSNGRDVVDLTASQFGAPSILLESVLDKRWVANVTNPWQLEDLEAGVQHRVNYWLHLWEKSQQKGHLKHGKRI